ncbi:MAG TPA: hypothetical protein VLG76_05120 [Rhabdochlamydiaceae bacterium]|nr:hypothetical protein [Rhabdochlamydiaceae bacterium]
MTPLIVPFLLACFALFFSPLFFPTFHLLAFAPFFATVFIRKGFLFSIWTAVLCGLLMDLLNSKFHFGFCAFNFCLTTLLVYAQRRNFFEDRLFSISCYTALISAVSSLIQLIFLALFEKHFPFKWHLIATDLILMPAFDALYGFLWFTCPMKIYKNIRKLKFR